MSRASQRPSVIAGIALMGAGLFAWSAAAAMLVDASALPSVKVADVLLTSTDQDAAVDAAAALANFTPDALVSPDLNIAISIDGVTLLHEGSATALSDPGDLAIAIGANTDAIASGGNLESAIAIGTNGANDTSADAFGGTLNTAVATNGGDATATDGGFLNPHSPITVSRMRSAAMGTPPRRATGPALSPISGNFESASASGNGADADSYNHPRRI